MPKGIISSAADGNYLETLNLSSSGSYFEEEEKKSKINSLYDYV